MTHAAATFPKTDASVLDIAHAVKRYGAVTALNDVSISVQPGEFLTLLGHSGSGKTTLLKLISGLESPDSVERLEIAGASVLDVPAALRDCCTVFQGYALFPHMSVIENVEFGLRVRSIPASERRKRAKEVLAMVRLADKGDRRIHQLSGGERQRVGLARALVVEPTILLLDEPLGALDERLRVDMQDELLQLQKQLGTTFVYVTHSREEALSMSDRIALMRAGQIVQLGTPRDLHDSPATRFVADFMGCETLLNGQLADIDADGAAAIEVPGLGRAQGRWTSIGQPENGMSATLALFAERVIATPGSRGDGLPGELSRVVYKGTHLHGTFETPCGPVVAALPSDFSTGVGTYHLSWAPDAAAVVPS